MLPQRHKIDEVLKTVGFGDVSTANLWVAKLIKKGKTQITNIRNKRQIHYNFLDINY
jgi:hypothetical protein